MKFDARILYMFLVDIIPANLLDTIVKQVEVKLDEELAKKNISLTKELIIDVVKFVLGDFDKNLQIAYENKLNWKHTAKGFTEGVDDEDDFLKGVKPCSTQDETCESCQ